MSKIESRFMKHIRMIIIVCAVFCCALSAGAGERTALVYDSFSPDTVLKIMKEEGYNVSLTDDNDIRWKLDGYKTWITFYKDNRSLQFYSGFSSDDATLAKHNEFNVKYRYGRSLMPKQGSARLEIDLDFDGGISKERLIDFLKTCSRLFTVWREKVL